MANYILKSGNNLLRSGSYILTTSDSAPLPDLDINPALFKNLDGNPYNNNELLPELQDSSGNQVKTLQLDTVRQALFKTNIIKGLPIIDFDGVNDYYTLGQYINTGALFAVVRAKNTTQRAAMFGNSANPNGPVSANSNWQWMGNLGSTAQWFNQNTTVNSATNITQGNNSKLYINGGNPIATHLALKTGAWELLTLDITNSAIGITQIGGEYRLNAGVEFFANFQFARIIVYRKRLIEYHLLKKRDELLTQYF